MNSELTKTRELTLAELEGVSGGMVATFRYGGFRMDIIANPVSVNICTSTDWGHDTTCHPL